MRAPAGWNCWFAAGIAPLASAAIANGCARVPPSNGRMKAWVLPPVRVTVTRRLALPKSELT